MIKLFLFLIIYSQFSFAQEPCVHDTKNFRCVKYIKNYDADTITFNIKDIHPIVGKKISVRVRGVDTPEIKTKNQCEKTKGRNAQKLVRNLLKRAKRIDLENIGRGKYFRIVADVIIDGKNLTEYLLKNNLAYSYNGGTKRKIDWCNFRKTASEEEK